MLDSVAYNPHKMLGAPLQASIFMTRHKEILHQTNCAASTYLFQQDKFYDVTAGKSITLIKNEINYYSLFFVFHDKTTEFDKFLISLRFWRQISSMWKKN